MAEVDGRCERCDEPVPAGARWCDPCASEDDDPEEFEWTPQDYVVLEAELDALAATDPAVKRAAENYDLTVRKILRGEADRG